jgi:RNA ligase
MQYFKIENIETISDLQNLLISGFLDWKKYGEVFTNIDGDLTIFNYTKECQYNRRWNFFERISRGLILNNKTGEIVARPFDKFFNWMEMGEKANGYIVNVTEKIDGSLGILYRINDGYKISTRGNFHSEQAEWATQFLNKNYNLENLPEDMTLLFEIIYPENRIVIDYGKFEGLILLASRNRFTGEYYPFFPTVYELGLFYGFITPRVYNFNNVVEIIEKTDVLNANQEGWVVEFSSGQRFKFKGDKYLELHKLISGLSFKHTLEAYQGGTIDYIRSQIPEEFLNEFNKWCDQIEKTIINIVYIVEQLFNIAPKESRKEFALWVIEKAKRYSLYLFAKYDNREYLSLIYKNEFKDMIELKDFDKLEI